MDWSQKVTSYVGGFGQWCVFEITSLFSVCVGVLNLAEKRVCGAFGLLVCLPQREGGAGGTWRRLIMEGKN